MLLSLELKALLIWPSTELALEITAVHCSSNLRLSGVEVGSEVYRVNGVEVCRVDGMEVCRVDGVEVCRVDGVEVCRVDGVVCRVSGVEVGLVFGVMDPVDVLTLICLDFGFHGRQAGGG